MDNQSFAEKYTELVPEYKKTVADRHSEKDFLEYNEVLFSAHSCAIEGNSFTVDETRTLKEKGLGMIPQGKTLLEAFEILDHFNAFEFVLEHLSEPISEWLLKETHARLTEHTLSYRTKMDDIPSLPGEYTTVDMAAGDTVFGDHKELISRVPNLMDATRKAMEEGNIPAMNIAASFHAFFEYLHPFRDGNGRVGRLMSNFILLKSGEPLLIIPKEKREEYITALKMVKKEGSHTYLTDFFYRTSIERMEKEMQEKRTMTEIGMKGFNYNEIADEGREL